MTGGRAVILGRTGRNFAAGHERRRGLRARRGRHVRASAATWASSASTSIEESDAIELHGLIEEHAERTGSPVAARILAAWAEYLPRFKKVMPHDYKRALRRAGRVRGRRIDRRRGVRHDRAERLMGKVGGFLEIARVEQPERDPRQRTADFNEFVAHAARRGPARAGRALHGVRRAVLPQRLPAGQPDPGLERPRLPRPLARGDRPAARDEQLPGVHRQALPGAVRGGVRAGDPRGRRGLDQADRGLDRQPRVGRGLDRAAAARASRPAAPSP